MDVWTVIWSVGTTLATGRGIVLTGPGAFLIATMLTGCQANRAQRTESRPIGPDSTFDIDLAIADDTYGRPAISDFAVRLLNHGQRETEGRLRLEVLDSAGEVLHVLNLSDPIRVPGWRDLSSRGGLTVSVPYDSVMDALLDSLELNHRWYGMRATIRAQGLDSNRANDSKTREWNVSVPSLPNQAQQIAFLFRNTLDSLIHARWMVHRTGSLASRLPANLPTPRGELIWRAGEEVHRTLGIAAPPHLPLGGFMETRLSLVADDSAVIQQHEWFQIYDTIPPLITDYRVLFLSNGAIGIQAYVDDLHSGVPERGVRTAYSVNEGTTWRTLTHDHKIDHVDRPTMFEIVLGPFSPNASVLVRVAARDRAGNVQRIIPPNGAGLLAPPGTEQWMAESSYSWKPNPAFVVDTHTSRLASAVHPVAPLEHFVSDLFSVAEVDALMRRRHRFADSLYHAWASRGIDLSLTPAVPVALTRLRAADFGLSFESVLRLEPVHGGNRR